jgi:site-specific DNA recombinase
MHGSRHLRALESGSKLPLMVGAVIYVRVSTKEQTQNLSLPTQLRACEEYCRREGYEILERFHEEGESAKTTDRSQLQNLLTYCRLNKGRVHFVVMFNLTRFARDPPSSCGLRRARQVRSLHAPLSPAVAGHLAAVGDGADRRHVHRQADGGGACRIRAIRQRLSLGPDPRRYEGRTGARALGVPGADRLLNAPRAMGKSLMPDPERAPLVRRAFEEYATGRFTKKRLLKQSRAWGLTNRRGRPLTSQAIGVLLRNQLYAGIVDVTELLRVLPLSPWLPRGQRDEGQTRRTVRRRTRPAAANARLHAATQGIRSADLEGSESGRARGTRDR